MSFKALNEKARLKMFFKALNKEIHHQKGVFVNWWIRGFFFRCHEQVIRIEKPKSQRNLWWNLPHSYQLVVTPSKHQVHGLGDPTRTKRPRCRKEWQAYGRVTISMCRLNPWKDRKMSSNFKHYHCHVLSKDVFCLEVTFFCQFSTQKSIQISK